MVVRVRTRKPWRPQLSIICIPSTKRRDPSSDPSRNVTRVWLLTRTHVSQRTAKSSSSHEGNGAFEPHDGRYDADARRNRYCRRTLIRCGCPEKSILSKNAARHGPSRRQALEQHIANSRKHEATVLAIGRVFCARCNARATCSEETLVAGRAGSCDAPGHAPGVPTLDPLRSPEPAASGTVYQPAIRTVILRESVLYHPRGV